MRYDLYINNQLCDLDDNSLIVLTYTMEQLSNPTAVKNTYSHEIELPNTERNNKVFSCIYRNDYRADANNFQPLTQTPFAIYNELSEIVESGYIKLDEISRNNTTHAYKVTLYGGLGSFFYALAYEGDSALSLADLQYMENNGDLYSSESRLNLTIDRNTIGERGAWGRLANSDYAELQEQYDVINFAPMYQGLPEGEFDANKAIFVGRSASYADTPDAPIYGITAPQGGNGYYKRKNADGSDSGYRMSLVELNEDHNEWEMGDLRSYLQRPILSIRKFVEAVQRRAMEQGYTLNLDENFFNEDNPYYAKAWMTLPSLQSITKNGKSASFYLSGELRLTSASSQTIPLSATLPTNQNGYEFGSTKTNTTLYIPKITIEDADYNGTLFPALCLGEMPVNWGDFHGCGIAYFVQMQARMNSASLLGLTASDIYILVNQYEKRDGATIAQLAGFTPPPNWRGEYKVVRGCFARRGTTILYDFSPSDKNAEPISLSLTIPITTNSEFVLLVNKFIYEQNSGSVQLSPSDVVGITRNAEGYSELYVVSTDGRITDIYGSGDVSANTQVRSGTIVSKRDLLDIGKTPLEVLLSYCKLFGLLWQYESRGKVVNLLQRTTFYGNAEVRDWSARIDRSKAMTIKPFEFDKRFYDFALEAHGEWAEQYKDIHGATYGRQRVNTGYSFDRESKNLLDGNALKGGAEVLQQSKYFCNITEGTYTLGSVTRDKVCPSVFLDGGKYALYDTNGDAVEYNITTPTNNATIGYYNAFQGYDWQSKLQMQSGGKLVNDSCVLLLHAGNLDITSDSPYKNLRLTDDIAEMSLLNDGVPCWVLEGSSYGSLQGETLPIFVRAGEGVSLDMGVPSELDNPSPDMDAVNNSIYSQYWQRYLGDRYDVNSRVVTCFVDLRGLQVGNRLFGDFYYFDNAVWVLNKIINYSMTTIDTTQCEFVKVQDVNNYKEQ